MRVSRGEYVLCLDFRWTVWVRIRMGLVSLSVVPMLGLDGGWEGTWANKELGGRG